MDEQEVKEHFEQFATTLNEFKEWMIRHDEADKHREKEFGEIKRDMWGNGTKGVKQMVLGFKQALDAVNTTLKAVQTTCASRCALANGRAFWREIAVRVVGGLAVGGALGFIIWLLQVYKAVPIGG